MPSEYEYNNTFHLNQAQSGRLCNANNIAYTPLFLTYLAAVPGLGLGDILRPELILPLIEEIPLEGELASHLPEVKIWLHCFPKLQELHW